MEQREKESTLPNITEIGWNTKSKLKRRAPHASPSSVNGSSSVSVPPCGEITGPIFQLTGQKMNTERVVDDQIAKAIATVFLSETTFSISCSPYLQEFHLKELSTKTTLRFIKDQSELSKLKQECDFSITEICDELIRNKTCPAYQRSLTCDGAGLSPGLSSGLSRYLVHIYFMFLIFLKLLPFRNSCHFVAEFDLIKIVQWIS